jgi:hypothetical protein
VISVHDPFCNMQSLACSAFQRQAEAAVLDVLAKNGETVGFVKATDSGGRPWMSVTLALREQPHEIEIFVDSVVMTCGSQLFEPYMPREFVSDEAQIQGFVTRLDRYLSGGSWEGADEGG